MPVRVRAGVLQCPKRRELQRVAGTYTECTYFMSAICHALCQNCARAKQDHLNPVREEHAYWPLSSSAFNHYGELIMSPSFAMRYKLAVIVPCMLLWSSGSGQSLPSERSTVSDSVVTLPLSSPLPSYGQLGGVRCRSSRLRICCKFPGHAVEDHA